MGDEDAALITNPFLRYLSERDLANLVHPSTLISTIERGLIDLLEQKVVLRARDHIAFGDSTLLTMPVVGADTFGTKIVSIHPSNVSRGLPVINGLMTLFDRTTGRPRAVMNAAALTAQRTGAVGAIGLKHTSPPGIERLGLVGTGVQGTSQAIYACAVRPICVIYFLERADEKAKDFSEIFSRLRPEIQLIRCADSESLVSQTQAIITATTSNSPVLPEDHELLRGKHFISIGSFKPNMQELPDAVFELTQQVVVDSDVARHEVGDLINPIAAGRLRAEGLIHLAELVAGRGTVNVNRTTIFKSVGMALYDLYAAQVFLAESERHNRGTKLEI